MSRRRPAALALAAVTILAALATVQEAHAADSTPTTTDSPQALVDAGQARQARDLALTLIARGPASEQDHLALSRADQDLLDWTSALHALEKAVVLFPRSVEIRLELAQLLENKTRFTSAIAEYRQALAIDPSNADIHTQLAGLLMRRGDLAGAAAEFEALSRIEPDEPSHPLALEGLYQALGQPDKAEQARQTAIRLDPALKEHVQRDNPLPSPPPPGQNPEERDEQAKLAKIAAWSARGVAPSERIIIKAQETVAPNTALIRSLSAHAGTLLKFRVTASAPIDVMVFSEEAAAAYRNVLKTGAGTASPEWSQTSVTRLDITWTFPRTGDFAWVIDNSAFPPGGASAEEPVRVDVTIANALQPRAALHVPYGWIETVSYARGLAGLTLTAAGRAALGGTHVAGRPAGLSGTDVLIDEARIAP